MTGYATLAKTACTVPVFLLFFVHRVIDRLMFNKAVMNPKL